jgi:hypothetical protein
MLGFPGLVPVQWTVVDCAPPVLELLPFGQSHSKLFEFLKLAFARTAHLTMLERRSYRNVDFPPLRGSYADSPVGSRARGGARRTSSRRGYRKSRIVVW